MRKQDFLNSLDQLASWWLDDEEGDVEEDKDIQASISLEFLQDGTIDVAFLLEEGKELELAAMIYNLTNGKFTGAMLEEIGRQHGVETLNSVFNLLSEMKVAEEQETPTIGSPIIPPDEVFKESQ